MSKKSTLQIGYPFQWSTSPFASFECCKDAMYLSFGQTTLDFKFCQTHEMSISSVFFFVGFVANKYRSGN